MEEMSFTAYYKLLILPEGAQAITRLGSPPRLRVELAVGQAPRRGAAACAGAAHVVRTRDVAMILNEDLGCTQGRF